MRFELVIFDCDGVLVDSEPIANRVLMERLASVGLRMDSEETMRTFVGRSASACLSMIEQRIGRPLPPAFQREWDDALFATFRRELRSVRGVADALEGIRIPVCVASSSAHDRMRVALDAAGLLPRFEGRLFSATDVARGKPHPDLFLHAAEAMGVRPEACAVIEDTEVGAAAAAAARMTVFGYAGGNHSDPERLRALGAILFRDMADLPQLLETN
jgi:HAD superfamily hydrolase (TIGR01509 family)